MSLAASRDQATRSMLSVELRDCDHPSIVLISLVFNRRFWPNFPPSLTVVQTSAETALDPRDSVCTRP